MPAEIDIITLRTKLLEKSGIHELGYNSYQKLSVAIFLATKHYISHKTLRNIFAGATSNTEIPSIIITMLNDYLNASDSSIDHTDTPG